MSIAPHQAETLREVAHETAEAELQSPRVSWANGKVNDTNELLQEFADDHNGADGQNLNGGGLGIEMYHHDQQDALAIAQNGGVSSADEDDLDGDVDGDLDDDMMDKISSSPSIEDGALNPVIMPAAWPRRESSLTSIPGQINAAIVLPKPVEPVALGQVSFGRILPVAETSVSRYREAEPVAEWQQWHDARKQHEWSSSSIHQNYIARSHSLANEEDGQNYGAVCEDKRRSTNAMEHCFEDSASLPKV